MQLSLAQRAVRKSAGALLAERAKHDEQVVIAGGAIWVYYPNGIAGTKLTPALLDRSAGAPVTSRNWRTALKLNDLFRLPSDQ